MLDPFLIVEDQENDVFLLKHALRKAGLANPVQVVEDGQEAIDYLRGEGIYADRASYPMPCLIFLDLKLPVLNGFEVLQWIRQQSELPPIVVVVLSASNMQEDIVQAYRLGANSYVVKPGSLETLVETVKDFSNWWLKHDRLRSAKPGARKLDVAGLPA